jgi:hypothetical protein
MRTKPPALLRWLALSGLWLLLVILIPTIWVLSRVAGPLIDLAEWCQAKVAELTDNPRPFSGPY